MNIFGHALPITDYMRTTADRPYKRRFKISLIILGVKT